MSTAKHVNEDQLLRQLDYKLAEYERVYGKGENLDKMDVNARLEFLVKEAFAKTGEPAVLIVDEYDAPLLDVMNDKVRLPSLRQIMRNFYSPIKSLDPYLRFVFMTGINKFAKPITFSERNNRRIFRWRLNTRRFAVFLRRSWRTIFNMVCRRLPTGRRFPTMKL